MARFMQIAVILLSERPDAEAVLRSTATCASIKSVRMRAPSHSSVIEYLGLVCACEERYLPPAMLQRLAFTCDGDLRSALQQLQFIASQGFPSTNGDECLHGMALEAIPMRLSHIHAPLPAEAAMQAGVAEGVSNSLNDCEWACAYLRHSTVPGTIAACSPDGCVNGRGLRAGCSAATPPTGPPCPESQCEQIACAGNPNAKVCPVPASGSACLATKTCADAGSFQQASGVHPRSDDAVPNTHASPTVKEPAWMPGMRARNDFAAAAVLDKWAGVLQQRQRAFQARLRGRPKERAVEAEPRCQAAHRLPVNAVSQRLATPDAIAAPVPGRVEDVSHLEDDMAVETAITKRPDMHAGACEEEKVQLLRGGAGSASSQGGSPGSAPAAASRQVLDDSDDDAGAGGRHVAAVATAAEGMRTGTEDEAAVVAAVVDELVAACERVRLGTTTCDANVRGLATPDSPAWGVSSVTPRRRHGDGSCGDGGDAGPSTGAAVPPCGGIAAAAAAAGMRAAAAALGRDAGAAVPSGAPAAGAAEAVAVQAPSRPDVAVQPAKGVRGGRKARSKGEPGVPKRGRGRPRASGCAASKAAVVLQQGQENMLRHIERIQLQATELRSQSAPDVPRQRPEGVGGRDLGKENSVPGEAQRQAGAKELSRACMVSDVVSASDVFGRHVVHGCGLDTCGAAGEWLWLDERCGEDSGPRGDAKPRVWSCQTRAGGLTAEQAEQLTGGMCGALWDCCGTTSADGAVEFTSPDCRCPRRAATMKSVQIGARDCSRHSRFDTWNALGSMSHDECAAAAAPAHDGAALKRTRRKRGHCAEAVSVWDIGVEDIGASALTWCMK